MVSPNSLPPFLRWSVISIEGKGCFLLGEGRPILTSFISQWRQVILFVCNGLFHSVSIYQFEGQTPTFLSDRHNLHSPHIPSWHRSWDSSNHDSLMNWSHHSTSGATYLDIFVTISNSELPFSNFLSFLSPSLCTFFLLCFLNPLPSEGKFWARHW